MTWHTTDEYTFSVDVHVLIGEHKGKTSVLENGYEALSNTEGQCNRPIIGRITVTSRCRVCRNHSTTTAYFPCKNGRGRLPTCIDKTREGGKVVLEDVVASTITTE